MLNDNLLLLTDSYKASHAKQYPANCSSVYSYFESRGSDEGFRECVFFGLQYFIKRYLVGKVVTREKIDEAAAMFGSHMGVFNREGWEYILSKHDGHLPIVIKAVPEGTVLPLKNVMMTVENTDPNCYWLTNYLETLLVQVWYSCTTATISREMKKTILSALNKSGDPTLIPFKLHDFGCRGVSSMETAAIGGAAHLVNFQGTDTVPALQMLRQYYKAGMAGFSIPAAEHSTITSWGKAHEVDAYRNMLQSYPTGLVAVVSDSYDIYNACKNIWGRELKAEVLKREGVLVIRPDSGDPKEVLPKLLNILGKEFGYETNDKGYKVLNNKVRLIQGDGVTRNSLGEILDAVLESGWSADNIAFGSGGGLLQQCNRDTLKFAFKCSNVVVDGEELDVFKQPVGASWKGSKKGRLKLIKNDLFITPTGSNWVTVSVGASNGYEIGADQLREVFRDGKLRIDDNLEVIRERAK